MYIKDTLKYKIRNDFNLNLNQCKYIWIEFQSKKLNLTLSTIYRHPNSDLQAFQYKLKENSVKLENSKSIYVINGDININLLKSSCSKVKNYSDMLISVGCQSLIYSPTRFCNKCVRSLLDHIYTNTSELKITSGLCPFDISDHIPTFFMLENMQIMTFNKPVLRRSMKNFNAENFVRDLQKQFKTPTVTNLNTNGSSKSY